MSAPKTQDRLRIEQALQESAIGLSIAALAEKTGVTLYSVNRHLITLRGTGDVVNLKGHRAHNPVYAWRKLKPPVECEVTPREPISGTYDGADLTRPPPRGDASMHAYTLPSHGRPRVAPFSMGSTHGQFAYKTL